MTEDKPKASVIFLDEFNIAPPKPIFQNIEALETLLKSYFEYPKWDKNSAHMLQRYEIFYFPDLKKEQT